MTSKSTKKLSLFKKKGWILITVGIFIRLFFYVSATKTHTLNQFFLPVTRGQDFFQIPNGAYSFIRGGDLQGKIGNKKNLYTSCCGVNDNVYHPFFTLLVGLPLQLLKPWTAFNLWLAVHLLFDILALLLLAKNFKGNQSLSLSLFLYLTNNFYYYEILNNQYHFWLNFAALFLIIKIYNNRDSVKEGLFYFLSLIAKPVGLLWLLPLAAYKRYKVAVTGVGLFFLVSLPFYFSSVGKYYFYNLYGAMRGAIPNYNILHLFRLLSYNLNNIYIWEAVYLAAIVFLVISKKAKIFTLIFFMTAFQLIFYGATYPYHYSILGPLLSLGILLGEIRIKFPEMVTVAFLTIPAPIVYWRFRGINIQQLEVTTFVFFSIVPLVLLISIMLFRIAIKK